MINLWSFREEGDNAKRMQSCMCFNKTVTIESLNAWNREPFFDRGMMELFKLVFLCKIS